MKTRTLRFISVLTLVFIFALIGCATGSKDYKKAFKEEVGGTWINPDY